MLYNKDGSPLFKLAQKIKKDSRSLFIDLEKSGFRHELPQHPRLGLAPPTSDIHEEESDAKQEGTENPESKIVYDLLVGDLEPAMQSLELFVSSDAIRRELNMELDDSMPVTSLFKFELAKMKPAPTETSEVDRTDGPMESKRREFAGTLSGGKKGGKKVKPKRDRKAEAERARLNKLAREEANTTIDNADETEEQSGHDVKKGKEKEQEFQARLDESAGFRAPSMWISSTPAVFGDESRRTAESETEASSKTKKRLSFAPVNQPTVPRVVSTVDNRDSFNLFHAGWILPADQKRGGRAPISQQLQQPTQPPPRKKQKTGMRIPYCCIFRYLCAVPDQGDAKVSVLDTSVEELQSPGRSLDYFFLCKI